jgi:hypothetical protein
MFAPATPGWGKNVMSTSAGGPHGPPTTSYQADEPAAAADAPPADAADASPAKPPASEAPVSGAAEDYPERKPSAPATTSAGPHGPPDTN